MEKQEFEELMLGINSLKVKYENIGNDLDRLERRLDRMYSKLSDVKNEIITANWIMNKINEMLSSDNDENAG